MIAFWPLILHQVADRLEPNCILCLKETPPDNSPHLESTLILLMTNGARVLRLSCSTSEGAHNWLVTWRRGQKTGLGWQVLRLPTPDGTLHSHPFVYNIYQEELLRSEADMQQWLDKHTLPLTVAELLREKVAILSPAQAEKVDYAAIFQVLRRPG